MKEGVARGEEAVAWGHDGGTQVHRGEYGGDGVAGEGGARGSRLHAGTGVVAPVRLILHAHSWFPLDGHMGYEPLLLLLLLLLLVVPPRRAIGDDRVDIFQLEIWELAV